LTLALLAKVGLVALLGSMDAELLMICSAIFAAHVVSRTLPLLLIYWLPHVGDTAASKSKPLADNINLSTLFIAFMWCFMALAPILWAQAAIDLVVGFSFSLMALLWMHRFFKRRLQGFTGDCLGATQQVCEIAFYLGLAIAL
jgi:adenosylcobinamide-GDP ribazoletransferase